ncbi:hypothetical protein PI125_g5666 [Phytophthora idaei]|nr:hypothetical protein PI125_g5666 [Phytophthora idaei]
MTKKMMMATATLLDPKSALSMPEATFMPNIPETKVPTAMLIDTSEKTSCTRSN